MLVGRNAELARIESLIAAAVDGTSGALVLRGEAGIGKSALLAAAADAADGATVLRAVGVEAESELPHAGLHQVLRPIMRLSGGLPAPQAQALEAAFGLAEAGAGDRFLVSLAALGLLADAAEERPLLVLVDDAQWLDAPSADALLFVARRLGAERIAMLLAVREPADRELRTPGLAELRPAPLEAREARELLASARVGMSRDERESVAAMAAGNPLALLELGAGGTASRGPRAVELAFFAQFARLPAATQQLLVVAACADSPDLGTVLAAARELGLEAGELAPAETAALIRVDAGGLRFRHPLVRSAIHRAAPFAQRRAAHLALAAALDVEEDADRCAWHLAAAASEVDEAVAAQLEASAARARDRGGHAAGSAALERAAELTAEGHDRARRLLAAAQDAQLAGRGERALALLDRAGEMSIPEMRADAALVRGRSALVNGRPADAQRLLADAAREIAERDPARALALLADALEAGAIGGSLAQAARTGGALADRMGTGADAEQAFLIVSLRTMRSFSHGDFTAQPALRDAIELVAGSRDPRTLARAALAAIYAGDDHLAFDFAVRAVERARSLGALEVLPFALCHVARFGVWGAHLVDGDAAASEARELTRESNLVTTECIACGMQAVAAALRGRDELATALAAETLALGEPYGLVIGTSTALIALAELDLARGRPDAALERILELLASPAGETMIGMLVVPMGVEAAWRSGEVGAARPMLARYRAWIAAARPSWALGQAARCEALMAPDAATAEREFERAIALHATHRRPLDEARTRLLYGEFLRRERRRADARTHLRAALEGFAALGAHLFSERASSELRATGETARRRDPSTLDQLTPQELQVARLVATGASNRDVAAQLFLSPRTVEYHLRKIFQKLAIGSRAELIRLGLAA